MDLRIVNTCNNNCLYCLEQEYRKLLKYIDKEYIFDKIRGDKGDNKIISFYGGNPLLHPDIFEIIKFCKSNGFISIGILTNTYGLSEVSLKRLIENGLNSFGFYFNSFNSEKHLLLNGGGISLKQLLENIVLLKKYKISYKCIIHVNLQNITNLYKDVLLLNKKFGVVNFEFVNYFPFDRPYNFNEKLRYFEDLERGNIDKLFKIISKIKLNVRFLKFPKDFFGEYEDYYDFENGVLLQIGQEDKERLEQGNKAFCFLENRCPSCFIKDNCKIYEGLNKI